MRFSLDPERVEFAGAVRRALADGCPPAVIRDAWAGNPLGRAVWQTLVDMGTTDPDLDHLTRVAVAEEVGRAALPHPWMETAFVVGPLIGERLGAQMATTDLGTPGRFPSGADADLLLTSDGRLADAGHAGHEPIDTVDGARRLTRVTVDDDQTVDIDIDDDARLAGTLGTAAVLIGLGQHLLDTTVAYVSERHQFGQPVGGFQAVKHHLADAAKDLTFARPMVHRAAHRLDTADTADPDAAVDVSTAKALASDAATRTAEVALQCHGAIGYTVEYDLHLWLKRVWALTRSWGDAAHHRSLVGEKLGLA